MSAVDTPNVNFAFNNSNSMSHSDLDRPLTPSSTLDGLLHEGDIVGDGIPLLGYPLNPVHFPVSLSRQLNSFDEKNKPAKSFEVVRKLGTGSYAVVYLVREILSSPPHRSSHLPLSSSTTDDEGMFEFDYASSSTSRSSTTSPTTSATSATVYGREFAIKCLSKANLDDDALAAQLLEVSGRVIYAPIGKY